MYNLANASIYFYSIQRGTPHVNLRQKRASLFNSQILVVALIGIFGGLKPKMCVHFSKDWRSVFPRSLALSYLFWHLQIQRYPSKLSPSRKFSQPFLSMKTSSDPAIKTSLGSVQCPL